MCGWAESNRVVVSKPPARAFQVQDRKRQLRLDEAASLARGWLAALYAKAAALVAAIWAALRSLLTFPVRALRGTPRASADTVPLKTAGMPAALGLIAMQQESGVLDSVYFWCCQPDLLVKIPRGYMVEGSKIKSRTSQHLT